MAKAKKTTKATTRKRPPKKPHESRFGRCTARERAACTVCTDEGKALCAAAASAHESARSPRKGDESDKRPFTPVVHPAVRWSLGSAFDGVYRTYVYLLSQTTADTPLVYRSPRHLAAGRDVTSNTFSEHITKLIDLKLIEKVPRGAVTSVGGRAFDAYLVVDLPPWTIRIAELLEKLSDGKLREHERKRVKTALRREQKMTLAHYDNAQQKRERGERSAKATKTRK